MNDYIDPKTVSLKDLIKDGKKVRFSYFRDNEFWYEHEGGFRFPISLQEATTGRATFLAEDKAIYYMRWIKRYIETCKLEEAPKGFDGERSKTLHSFPQGSITTKE